MKIWQRGTALLFPYKAAMLVLTLSSFENSHVLAKGRCSSKIVSALQSLSKSDFADLQFRIRESSTRFDRKIKHALRTLDRIDGNGFAILNTSQFFPKKIIRRIFNKLPKPSQFTVNNGQNTWSKRGELSFGENEKYLLSAEQLAPFNQFSNWLTKKLNQILPADEQIEIDGVDIRIWSKSQGGNTYPKWHRDGEYLAAVVSLIGPGIEYISNSDAFRNIDDDDLDQQLKGQPVPSGHTLIFSTNDRSKRWPAVSSIIHRSPPMTDRMMLLIRFKLKTRYTTKDL